jgi:hypothetical protein
MKTFILSVLLLGLTEVVIKPVITRIFKIGIQAYLVPAYTKLDNLLLLPDNWEHFIDNAEEFLYKYVIPAELAEEDFELAEDLVAYLIDNFDLKTFLRKQGQVPAQLSEV